MNTKEKEEKIKWIIRYNDWLWEHWKYYFVRREK